VEDYPLLGWYLDHAQQQSGLKGDVIAAGRTGVAVDQRIDLGPGGGLQQRLKKVSGTVS